ncbi:hypothetical protein SAMN04488072_11035 [Lentibacillus halodurans]|uniref:Peptidase propeptide and YPEB domain-containing protein n=1 Tax=Lentibacillus halodurans TaxID=237679 RepID=A0A1I0ZBD7_9BACI|nr:hypothetical protein [Lentibacillus halodurans]SFB21728.1 hypothetical protein SAMN04488072_11035 [Lentibacillus halodurans]
MRSLFLSTAAGALLFASAAGTESAKVTGAAGANHKPGEDTKMIQTDRQNRNVAYDDAANGMYPESDILDEQVDADHYQMQVVENNENIRIIVLKDENGHAQYKSIFQKHRHLVKVIDFDQGMVFKGVIGT